MKDANRITISFQVSPPTGAIKKLNISDCLNFSTNAATSLNEIEVFTDRILIHLDFYENLVGNLANIKLKFDPQFVRAPAVNLHFPLQAANG